MVIITILTVSVSLLSPLTYESHLHSRTTIVTPLRLVWKIKGKLSTLSLLLFLYSVLKHK